MDGRESQKLPTIKLLSKKKVSAPQRWIVWMAQLLIIVTTTTKKTFHLEKSLMMQMDGGESFLQSKLLSEKKVLAALEMQMDGRNASIAINCYNKKHCLQRNPWWCRWMLGIVKCFLRSKRLSKIFFGLFEMNSRNGWSVINCYNIKHCLQRSPWWCRWMLGRVKRFLQSRLLSKKKVLAPERCRWMVRMVQLPLIVTTKHIFPKKSLVM